VSVYFVYLCEEIYLNTDCHNFRLFLFTVGDGGSKIIKGAGKGVGQIVGGGKMLYLNYKLCSFPLYLIQFN
jgi:hypothetical protein